MSQFEKWAAEWNGGMLNDNDDSARVAKAAAQAAWQAAQPKWQPIYTAPDRKEVLVHIQEGPVCTAMKDGRDWWYTVGNGEVIEIADFERPTRWMPAPEVPE